MAELPIFQSQEQFQPTEIESGAAVTAKLGELADQENKRAYNIAQSEADTKALKAGSLAGQDVNFQTW